MALKYESPSVERALVVAVSLGRGDPRCDELARAWSVARRSGACTSDGRRIAAGSCDGSVLLVDVGSRRARMLFEHATGTADGTLSAWLAPHGANDKPARAAPRRYADEEVARA